MSFTWTRPPSQVFPELTRVYQLQVQRAVHAVMQRYAPEIEAWMKSNAPWDDRTGNARQGLYTELQQAEELFVRLILAHGMFYGWYLEGINPKTMMAMQNAGRWNIINPALDYFGPRIWAEIRRMLA